MSNEAEPEELPDFDAGEFLRMTDRRNRKKLSFFCRYVQKKLFYLL
jgi:hypothetical protein